MDLCARKAWFSFWPINSWVSWRSYIAWHSMVTRWSRLKKNVAWTSWRSWWAWWTW